MSEATCLAGALWSILQESALKRHVQSAKEMGMVMSTVSKKRLWQVALELIPHFKESSVEADVIAYNVGISSCERAQSWSKAVELLQVMNEQGLAPDEVTFNTLMAACGKLWASALSLLEGATVTPGLSASTYTFNSCLGACERCWQWRVAGSLFDEMGIGSVEPDVYSFTSAINACRGKAWSWLAACEFLEKMTAQTAVPNEITYSSLMQACSAGSLPASSGLIWSGGITQV